MMREEKPRKDLDFLPEAMVQDMLSKQAEVIGRIGGDIKKLGSLKARIREELISAGLIRNFADEARQRSYPTTAGVDGTRSRIMQLSMDTAAVAAVAVEGLTPPRETRTWEKPQHIVRIYSLEHNPRTDECMRGLMFSFELELACKSPHRVVMLDGSFTSTLVGIGQSLLYRNEAPAELRAEIESRLKHTLRDFLEVLTSPRIDKIYVALPKYTERREVIKILRERGISDPVLDKVDDKGLLTIVLRSQEFVGPLPLEQPKPFHPGMRPWHLTGVPQEFSDLETAITGRNGVDGAMDKLQVVYLKPSPFHPALRAEVSRQVALDRRRLLILLEALLDQMTPGILEPYPLYIADLFVKHVHGSLIELREAAIADMARERDVDLSDFFLSLRDYRSEGRFE